MVAKKKQVSRGPCKEIAEARLKVKKGKQAATRKAQAVEAKLRKGGGYGKKCVSIWAIPPGGLKNSPAARKVQQRCGGTMLPAEQRQGRPVSGGFPLKKYPPNVFVDAYRFCWLPDDWAQAIKNTGPGGTYLGWMSPEGKFFYHRHGYPSGIEETLGRKLTPMDGFNGTLRAAREIVKPDADKEFLRQCLTPAERKSLPPASDFHFAVVSARRATIEQGIADIMMVEGHFRLAGVGQPTWYVDADSLSDYKGLGLNAKVGGKLTPARNMALDDAKRKNKICVQISDDISKWEYFDVERQNFLGEVTFHKANAAYAGSRRHCVSPVAAAQFLLAKMRSSPLKPKVAGVFPTANAAMALGTEEYHTQHFILGDFFVAEPSSPCRFDNNMTLKEDYDYACSHISKHGSVLRCNRLFVHAKHSTNAGGAVATRDASGSKERYNIDILQKKWPGVFKLNSKRKDEVLMRWSNHGSGESDAAVPPTKSRAAKSTKVKKIGLKKPSKIRTTFPLSAVLRYTGQASSVPYLTKRCKDLNKSTVEQSLRTTYVNASGVKKTYGHADLSYDVKGGRLTVKR